MRGTTGDRWIRLTKAGNVEGVPISLHQHACIIHVYYRLSVLTYVTDNRMVITYFMHILRHCSWSMYPSVKCHIIDLLVHFTLIPQNMNWNGGILTESLSITQLTIVS